MFTRNTPITIELLTEMKACEGATNFLEAFNLEGYSLNDLEITGDYRGYISWLDDKVVYPYIFNSGGIVITDIADKRIAEIKASSGTAYWSERTCDSNGNQLTSVDSDGYTFTWTYDSNGNVLTYVNSKGVTSTWTYDDSDNSNDDDGHTSTITYDSNGNILTSKDSYGYTETWTYDSNGNKLTYVTSNGYSYKHTYDSNGNKLTYVTSNGHRETWTYDSNGNQLTYKDSNGFNYNTSNLPEGILCQVFRYKEVILSIAKK